QCTGVDCGRACVGVCGSQRCCPTTSLREGTRAADGASTEVGALHHCVASIDRKVGVVSDGATRGKRSGSSAVAELKSATADCCCTSVSISAAKRERACAGLRQRASREAAAAGGAVLNHARKGRARIVAALGQISVSQKSIPAAFERAD